MSDARPNLSKRPAPGRNPGSATLAPRPVQALAATIALAASGVFAVVSALGVLSQKTWIYTSSLKSLTKTNDKAKAKDRKTAAELRKMAHDQIATTHKGVLYGALIVLVAVAFVGFGVYRGKYWSRWATIGIWVLCSFTGTLVGIGSLLAVTADIPGVVKVPAFLGALSMVSAVLFVNLKPAAQWFALSKPVPAAGAPARRGLFAPRPAAAGGARAGAATKPAQTRPAGAADRARSKKRVADTQASVAKGADLARTRAKAASKSRRTEA